MPRGWNRALPRATKELRGTLRKARDPKAGKQSPAPTKVGPPPAGFTARQRKVWLELGPQVERVFTASDRASFVLLVKLYALIDDPTAKLVPSAFARLCQVVSGMLQTFGCTPSSRDRVRAPETSSDDALEEFLFNPSPRSGAAQGTH